LSRKHIGIAIIGAGAVSHLQYYPAISLDHRASLAAVCDSNLDLARQRQTDWQTDAIFQDYRDVLAKRDVDAVVIATPNFTHVEIGLAALAAGKHVLCEKPLGVSAAQVTALCQLAQDKGLINMTAFTYRFPPAMKYLRNLVKLGSLGRPRHFRSQRFLDLPETSWGWRQYQAQAGAGDLYDMTIHRIDFAMDLLGPIHQVCGAVARFAERTTTPDGRTCPPSDVDDWSALIGVFDSGAVGVWEGTTLAKGYRLGGYNHEWAEINGSEGTAVYRLHKPNTILIGRHGGDLEEQPVPNEFLKPVDSPRSTTEPNPAIVFRYDIMWEFVSAICEGRPAVPSFLDGWRAQCVADAVLASHREGKWVTVDYSAAGY
jgi:predicted dehydrogenase